MSAERTLVIFKPDCMEKRLVGTVLSRFDAAGFAIVGCKLVHLQPEVLRAHYAHLVHEPYYPPLEKFMNSRPVLLMVLAGADVVTRVRDLLGPTDSRKAPKGTIRGDFGTDVRVNIAHASDSPASAAAEIARFFSPSELFG
jgi:nucleoside-diphosphate kinase